MSNFSLFPPPRYVARPTSFPNTPLAQVGQFDEAQARFYAASLALALGHLHSEGYMYRDVKPENLLLTAGGRLKLCDLGKRTDSGSLGCGRLLFCTLCPWLNSLLASEPSAHCWGQALVVRFR
jgi:serine/threonine protein kinase